MGVYLAKEVGILNGVSTEGIATQVSAALSAIGGVIVGFYFSW